MTSEIIIYPSQGYTPGDASKGCRIYEIPKTVSDSSTRRVVLNKDSSQTYVWNFSFLFPSSTTNDQNGMIKVRWFSTTATSGTPHLQLKRWLLASGTDYTLSTSSFTNTVTGTTFLGQGVIHETIFPLTGTSSVSASSLLACSIQRVNGATDKLDGHVEILNVSITFKTSNTNQVQFAWFPAPSIVYPNDQLTTSSPIFSRDLIANTEYFPVVAFDPSIYNYCFGSIITPMNFSSVFKVIPVYRTGLGSTNKNIMKISAGVLGQNEAVNNTVTYSSQTTNEYTESVGTGRINIYATTIDLSGSINRKQLFVKVARQADDGTDSSNANYLHGFLLEWPTAIQYSTLALKPGAVTQQSTLFTKIEHKDINNPTYYQILRSDLSTQGTYDLSIPTSYYSNGRFVIYYTCRNSASTGTAQIQLFLSSKATGDAYDTVMASGSIISIDTSVNAGVLNYTTDTSFVNYIAPGVVANLKIKRLDTSSSFDIDIKQINLEFIPKILE